MNVLKEGKGVESKFVSGHISSLMLCPLCRYESEVQSAFYPEMIKCPYCKTQFKIVSFLKS